MRRTLFLLVARAALTACNPRLYPPQVETPDNYLYAGRFRQDSLAGSEEWWHVFRDPTLDSLISQALANNRDVAVAAARVQQARANLKTVRAQYLPQIGAEATAEGEYTPETKIVQSYAVEPTLSWELSLFGALRNAKRAAKAEIAASEWALAGVRLSLAAEVATTYFTLLEYERDLSIARQTLRLRRESAALIDSMFRYGMSDGVALEQARSLVYTAEADIPQYCRAVEQTWLSMGILLGETPSRRRNCKRPCGNPPASGESLSSSTRPGRSPARGIRTASRRRSPVSPTPRRGISHTARRFRTNRSVRLSYPASSSRLEYTAKGSKKSDGCKIGPPRSAKPSDL